MVYHFLGLKEKRTRRTNTVRMMISDHIRGTICQKQVQKERKEKAKAESAP